MSIVNVAASIPVGNLETGRHWYRQLLGRPPDDERVANVIEWKFDGGGALQVYELPERAGNGSATLSVTSLAEQMKAFTRLGIAAPGIMEARGARVLMIKDPDGNSLAFVEAASSDPASPKANGA